MILLKRNFPDTKRELMHSKPRRQHECYTKGQKINLEMSLQSGKPEKWQPKE